MKRRISNRVWISITIVLVCLGILCGLRKPAPVFPLHGGGYFEVMETTQGSNAVLHVGNRQQMTLYRIFGRHVPERYKTVQYPIAPLGTNSLFISLNKPITDDDFNKQRTLNGSFSLSLATASGEEYFGMQRAVHFHSIGIGTSSANRLTDEQIIFEFTNPPSAYARLRMYQTNVSNGTVTVTTNEIPFTPDH